MVKIDIKSADELVELVRELQQTRCSRLKIGTLEIEFGAPPDPEPQRPAGFEPPVRREADLGVDEEEEAMPRTVLDDPDLYGGAVPSLPSFDSDDEEK
jgi:hypothetical protein